MNCNHCGVVLVPDTAEDRSGNQYWTDVQSKHARCKTCESARANRYNKANRALINERRRNKRARIRAAKEAGPLATMLGLSA